MNYYPPYSHPDIIEGLYAHSDASVVLIVHQGLERGPNFSYHEYVEKPLHEYFIE
jgi:hypothetical protein